MSMTTQEIIAVLKDYQDGKEIQFRVSYDRPWKYVVGKPLWNFGQNEYRAKPEPRKPREIWVNEYPGIDCIYTQRRILYNSKSAAEENVNPTVKSKCTKFVEVIEDDVN